MLLFGGGFRPGACFAGFLRSEGKPCGTLVKSQVVQSAPRARGDGPGVIATQARDPQCSPRTRGWSPVATASGHRCKVLPAHAGMVPGKPEAWQRGAGAPRARGDGPRHDGPAVGVRGCSPRTRGWSLSDLRDSGSIEVLPAHAGMVPPYIRVSADIRSAPRARGDGPKGNKTPFQLLTCSPRTRGWSLVTGQGDPLVGVLPAHAGMVPSASRRVSIAMSAPRARGDGPAPRSLQKRIGPVLPAHAGMVPVRLGPGPAHLGAPRARGDGPNQLPAIGVKRLVLPAHAGMVPSSRGCRSADRCAPRARGDGPGAWISVPGVSTCSPRTRGWSLPARAS